MLSTIYKLNPWSSSPRRPLPPLPQEIKGEVLAHLPNTRDYFRAAHLDTSWRTAALDVPALQRHLRQNGRSGPPDLSALMETAAAILATERNLCAGRCHVRLMSLEDFARASTGARTSPQNPFRLPPEERWSRTRVGTSANGHWAVTADRSSEDFNTFDIVVWALGQEQSKRGAGQVTPRAKPDWLKVNGGDGGWLRAAPEVVDVAVSDCGHRALVHAPHDDYLLHMASGKSITTVLRGGRGYRDFDMTAPTACLAPSGRWGVIDVDPWKRGLSLWNFTGPRPQCTTLDDPNLRGPKEELFFSPDESRIYVRLCRQSLAYCLDFGAGALPA